LTVLAGCAVFDSVLEPPTDALREKDSSIAILQNKLDGVRKEYDEKLAKLREEHKRKSLELEKKRL